MINSMVGRQIEITRFKEKEAYSSKSGKIVRVLEHFYVGNGQDYGNMKKFSQVYIVEWLDHEICVTPKEIGYLK